MGPAAAVLAFVLLIPGGFVGWHAHRTRTAHRDLKSTRGRLPGLKQIRFRSGVFTAAAVVIILFGIYDLARH